MTDAEEREAALVEGALLAAHTMRHYLNNRLALTVGYMEIIADDPSLPDHIRTLAGKAIEGAKSASAILRRLQHLERIDLEPNWSGPPILDLSKLDP